MNDDYRSIYIDTNSDEYCLYCEGYPVGCPVGFDRYQCKRQKCEKLHDGCQCKRCGAVIRAGRVCPQCRKIRRVSIRTAIWTKLIRHYRVEILEVAAAIAVVSALAIWLITR